MKRDGVIEMVGDVRIERHTVRSSYVLRDSTGFKLGRASYARVTYYACKGPLDVPARSLSHARRIARDMT